MTSASECLENDELCHDNVVNPGEIIDPGHDCVEPLVELVSVQKHHKPVQADEGIVRLVYEEVLS